MSAVTSKSAGRDRILEVALKEFAIRGYDGAGVVKIATDAGVSQSSIHYHFKSKRALWEAAMLQLGASIARDRKVLEELYGYLPPLEKLKATCALIVEDAASRPYLGQVILSEGQIGGERMEWLLQHVLSKPYDDFLEILEDCMLAGQIKRFKTSQLLMLLTGAAVTQFNVAPLVSSVFGDDPKKRSNVDDFKAMYLDVVFSGLTSQTEE